MSSKKGHLSAFLISLALRATEKAICGSVPRPLRVTEAVPSTRRLEGQFFGRHCRICAGYRSLAFRNLEILWSKTICETAGHEVEAKLRSTRQGFRRHRSIKLWHTSPRFHYLFFFFLWLPRHAQSHQAQASRVVAAVTLTGRSHNPAYMATPWYGDPPPPSPQTPGNPPPHAYTYARSC